MMDINKNKKLLKFVLHIPGYIKKSNLRKSYFYLKNFGLKFFLKKIKKHINLYDPNINMYPNWVVRNSPGYDELQKQRCTRFSYEPKISIIVPVFNTPTKILVDMIESVLNQTYFNWELCIADGGSANKDIREILNSYAEKHSNIKMKLLDKNFGIARNSNEAIKLSTGEYITFLDHDDMLPCYSLFEVVNAINKEKEADFIYSDEDKISEDGSRRFDPHFKPDWSPDTLRSYNYICHLFVIRRELLEKVGHFREGFDGSQDYDLILRASEKAKKILHIPKILYHWRANANSAADMEVGKIYALDSAKKALKEHLKRTGLYGDINNGLFLSSYRIRYNIKNNQKISIIIPNKDHASDLDRCIKSIISKSTYKNYEIIIVENNSTEDDTFSIYSMLESIDNVRILKWDKPFNYSAINNFAVKYAEGEILLLLNNDTEVINDDWLECMLEYAQRDDVGAVGAKLYYPDDTIQHGGVVVGIGGVAGHSHKYFPKDSYGHACRLKVVQNLSAVTGACMMIRKEIYDKVDGMDEGLAVAFNDVDFCLKIRQIGKLIVWTPYAELYHYESKTRGLEDTSIKQRRFENEILLFKKRWGSFLKQGDPYYNPNLTLEGEDFSLKI